MATHAEGLLAGRYRRIAPIGVGGMARVFLAEDERLGRRVAIKQLHAESPAEAAERFEREAKLGASLNHPNLVSIYDIATDAESVLIVMEYVEGETLKDAIAAGPIGVARVVSVVHDLAAALGHAHSHGIVHRDVKPANILLRADGVTKLADLGIATAAEGTSITRSGVVLGTASYMAPEQLDGQRAGPAADVYALAAVAFEALSGRKALAGETPMEIAHRVVSEPPPDLREAWPHAPEGAAAALRRGMARRPEERPSSASELATALQRGLRGTAVGAASGPPVTAETVKAAPAGARDPGERRGYRRARQTPSWLPAAMAVAALGVLAIAAFALLGGGGDGKRTADSGRASPKQGERGHAQGATPDTSSDGAAGTQASGSGSSSAGSGSGSGTGSGGSGAGGSGSSSGSPSGGTSSGGDAAALNSRGYELMRSGRYQEAIPVLQRAVAASSPSSTDLTYAYALYNLGRSLRLAGRPKEAVPILEKRLRIPNQRATVRKELQAARREAA